MSAVENLLKRKGPATVETSEIIKDGESVTVDSRRARSLVSRGLAEYADDVEPTPAEPAAAVEPSTPAEAASDSQVARTDAHADRSLKALTKDELVEVAGHYELDTEGTKDVLIERINDHLSAAPVAGATAGNVPLSGSDSDGD